MKFKHRYINKILVIIMLLIGMYLIVYSFRFLEDDYSAVVNDLEMSNWQLEVEGTDFKEEIQLPYEMNENYDKNKLTITSIIPTKNLYNPYLMIGVAQQAMKVYLAGELIYEFESMLDSRNKTSGAIWRLVELPEDCYGKEIAISFVSSYKETAGIINRVYFGNKNDQILILLEKSIVSLFIGFTLIVLSIFIMLMYLFTKVRFQNEMREYLYLSIFLLLLATWVLIESQGLPFIINNFAFYYYLEFMALYMMPIFFYRYVFYSYDIEKKEVINLLAEFHRVLLAVILVGEITGVYDFFQVQLVFLVLFVITLIICIIVLCINVKSNKNILKFIITISIVVVMVVCDTILFYSKPINLGRNLILLAIVIIEILLGFRILNKVFSYFQANTENNYLQKQIRNNLYYYSNIKNKSNKLKSFRHDMKNHFVAISYLLEGGRIEEAKKYVSALNEHIIESSEIIDSGNYILDAIITEKKIRAEKMGISFSINLNIKPDIRIDPVDWCVIFGNILDNALEACSNLQNGEKKIIVDLKTGGNLFIINIWNSFDGKIIKGKSGYKTRKLNKEYHGFGLKNIIESIKKYEGTYNIDTTENMFKISIILMDVF